MLQAFKQNWQEKFGYLTPTNSYLFIAVSGGLDSIVLTHLVASLGFKFSILHGNFQLRGEESERDEAFVKTIAAKYQQPILINKFNTQQYAIENKISIQVAARALRYQWFDEVVNSSQLSANNNLSSVVSCLLTAHHADDNIETVLMNIFRGTGIKGLHGILEQQDYIIRPLLFAQKKELKAFAIQQNLQWVEDSSNESNKYSRNFFRHQIIPLVKKVFENADNNLLNNIEKWKETEIIYNQFITQLKSNLLEKKGNEIHIPVLKLAKQKPLKTIVHEIIIEYNFTAAQVNDVLKLLDAESGKFVASPTHKIFRNRNWLIITPVISQQTSHILIEDNEQEVSYNEHTLAIIKTTADKFIISENKQEVFVDTASIQFPLLLRKWKQGDYFYPLGMQKKKKLSRFFIDAKLSTTQKENIWVLETNKKIVWVIGFRIDDRFKVTAKTNSLLKLAVR